MNLDEYLKLAKPIDEISIEGAKEHWSTVAKPLNSLGILEEAVVRIAGIERKINIDISRKALIIMCADNGVVEEGVTQSPSEVTAIVTENFAKGDTSVCKMARVANATIFPIDIGVARDLTEAGVINKKIAYGTYNMTKGSAMTAEQAENAIIVGIEMVRDLKEQGYNLFATGEMGIGNTTTSSAIASVLLDMEVEAVTGRGAGLSSVGLTKKINAIKKAIEVNKPNKDNGLDVLAKLGGFDIAGMAGVFIGGAIYQVPVLVDGIISSVAALVAMKICPIAKKYMIASHVSKEPAGQAVMKMLELKPFLTCEMCLGEGTGAVAAMPILDMAASVYNEMSTFNEIKVEQYVPLN
ncbi:MAG: nicotinate-nucleotide--dimethylbenzimidazole phosphoribosyltransferase [Oscillospiraceae bacterium]